MEEKSNWQGNKKAGAKWTLGRRATRFSSPALIFYATLFIAGFLLVPTQTAQAQAAAAGPTISHPVKEFRDGKARHYRYKTADGIVIKYFILKSSDGVIRAAFDACDVCWPEGKGYFQKGDFMNCRNCGKQFASHRVNEVKGGCNPAPLARMVVGDAIIIRVKDILEGKKYFNFSERG